MPIDLKYWRQRLAAQEHSDSPHVGLTTAQFAGILDEVDAGRERLAALEQDAAGLRERLLAIEWDEACSPVQCAWCFGFREGGHEAGCKFADLLGVQS